MSGFAIGPAADPNTKFSRVAVSLCQTSDGRNFLLPLAYLVSKRVFFLPPSTYGMIHGTSVTSSTMFALFVLFPFIKVANYATITWIKAPQVGQIATPKLRDGQIRIVEVGTWCPPGGCGRRRPATSHQAIVTDRQNQIVAASAVRPFMVLICERSEQRCKVVDLGNRRMLTLQPQSADFGPRVESGETEPRSFVERRATGGEWAYAYFIIAGRAWHSVLALLIGSAALGWMSHFRTVKWRREEPGTMAEVSSRARFNAVSISSLLIGLGAVAEVGGMTGFILPMLLMIAVSAMVGSFAAGIGVGEPPVGPGPSATALLRMAKLGVGR